MNEPPTVDSNQPSSNERTPQSRGVTWFGLLSILGGFFSFIIFIFIDGTSRQKTYIDSRLGGQREYIIHRDGMVQDDMLAHREEVYTQLLSIRQELDAVRNVTGEIDENDIGLGQTGLVNFPDTGKRDASGSSEDP